MTAFAIIGKTNAGKSTLFNRLAGRRIAIVHARAGTTRDRNETVCEISGRQYRLIDTAGLEPGGEDKHLFEMAWDQTRRAIAMSDVLILVGDGRDGRHTSLDSMLAKEVRQSGKPVMVVAAKIEGPADPAVFPGLALLESMNLGHVIPLSAEHNQGVSELLDLMAKYPGIDEEPADSAPVKKPSVAIIGRPNVGKSTLANSLLGGQRMVTSPVAGTTRDPVKVELPGFFLTDTAGQRRGRKIEDSLENLSVMQARKAADYADVALVVVDATQSLDRQDQAIIGDAIENGRAIIVAINKWDAVPAPRRAEALKHFRQRLAFPQVKQMPVITVSALKKSGIGKIAELAGDVYKAWNVRISTAKLNRWLETALEQNPPPMSKTGRRISLKYISQPKTRPPHFTISTSSRTQDLPESYVRYLRNSLAGEFGLESVPVRLTVSKARNPYKK
ncbi:MAG: ribosome biogenesis GTPase Der [Alphaproteobacteria bacterium]|nr:ribosome biogenesis GTPase Der [Alphaproteobacteria bacterium]